jgi:hypothetical protein
MLLIFSFGLQIGASWVLFGFSRGSPYAGPDQSLFNEASQYAAAVEMSSPFE